MEPEKEELSQFAETKRMLGGLFDAVRKHMSKSDHSGLHKHRDDLTRTGLPAKFKKGQGKRKVKKK